MVTGSAYSNTPRHRGRAALRGSSKGFLEDGREPAGLVAGGGVVVHLAAIAGGVFFPPGDAADELFADLASRSASREQMLRAKNLRGLRKNGGAAVAHQNIGRCAQRRIGRDARITIRSAALKRQHQLGCRHRFASCKVRGRQHVADHLKARRDRFAGAAHILDRHGAECVALGHPIGFLPATDLEHLASETHHQHARHVGIGGVTPLRALQDVIALALVVHGAAGAVDERDDTVDIGIIVEQAGAFDFACDEAGHGSRAIHAGEDREIIARADFAVRAPETLECRLFGDRQDLFSSRILGKAIIARKIMQHDVVFMQPLARRDRLVPAKPIVCPNLRIGSPSAIAAIAILCPRGIRASAVTP